MAYNFFKKGWRHNKNKKKKKLMKGAKGWKEFYSFSYHCLYYQYCKCFQYSGSAGTLPYRLAASSTPPPLDSSSTISPPPAIRSMQYHMEYFGFFTLQEYDYQMFSSVSTLRETKHVNTNNISHAIITQGS